jgi:hypothetical protein
VASTKIATLRSRLASMKTSRQPHTRKPLELTLLRMAGRFGLITCGALILGLAIPGMLAWKDNVFFHESTKIVVESKKPEIKKSLDAYDANQKRLKNAIAAFDENFAKNPGNLALLVGQRRSYIAELREPAHDSVQEFYLHLIMYFWPIMYFGLGTVAFMMRPNGEGSLRFWSKPWLTFITSICIYVYTVAPLVFRTQVARFHNDDRTVFAYSNPDIDLPSHIAQLSNFYILALLLAIIWIEWSAWSTELDKRLDAQEIEDQTINAQGLNDLSRDLLRWQISFLAISVGFVTYTAIFWDQMIINHDRRFGFEAINIHILWLATVVFISAPLAKRWHRWQLQKIRIVSALINSGMDADLIKAKLDAIQELQPIGKWNITASGIAVILSFAGPLLQALIKKSLAGGEAGH